MQGTARLRVSAEGQQQAVAELRRALAAQAPAPQGRAPLPTQVSVLDAALQGGLPPGKLVELVGGAGKLAFSLLALAAATGRGELCALVDTDDGLDVQTAARVGVDLERLLWVRTPAGGSPLVDGLKAVDLLLGAGGFALIVLYGARLGGGFGVAPTVWPRLVQRCEKAGAALLVVSDHSVAGSAAAATLRSAPGETVWERAPGGRLILSGQRAAIEVVRSRLGPPGEVAEQPLLRK